MTVLLDSWAWMEYFFGSEKGEKVRAILDEASEPILATKVNVFEVYHKILKERGKEPAERFVQFMLGRSHLDALDVDTLKLAAEEKKKYALGMADAIILATAVKHGARLFTGDPDFKRTAALVETVFL